MQVLFPLDPDGTINPTIRSLPGAEVIEKRTQS
jgi:hypothetical protein